MKIQLSKVFLPLETDRCWFQIGYGSHMVPCCLGIIDCEKYDNEFKNYLENGWVGGAFGEHRHCPEDAEKAHRLIAGV